MLGRQFKFTYPAFTFGNVLVIVLQNKGEVLFRETGQFVSVPEHCLVLFAHCFLSFRLDFLGGCVWLIFGLPFSEMTNRSFTLVVPQYFITLQAYSTSFQVTRKKLKPHLNTYNAIQKTKKQKQIFLHSKICTHPAIFFNFSFTIFLSSADRVKKPGRFSPLSKNSNSSLFLTKQSRWCQRSIGPYMRARSSS